MLNMTEAAISADTDDLKLAKTEEGERPHYKGTGEELSGEPRYKRILLKLSGEALAGDLGSGIDPNIVNVIAEQVREVVEHDVEVAIVVGGGNIWRGLAAAAQGMDRSTADYMGILATVLTAL